MNYEVLKNEICSRRQDGVTERDGRLELDSLARLDVLLILEEEAPGFFEGCLNELSHCIYLDEIVEVLHRYVLSARASGVER